MSLPGGNYITQPGAGDPPETVSFLRRSLTSADILGLGSPMEILPAPGEGLMHVVVFALYCLNFETTPYGGDQMGLWYGTSISADTGSAGVFNGSSSGVQQALCWSTLYQQPFPDGLCVNAPLNLWSPNTSAQGGDSLGALVLGYSTLRIQ